MGEMEEDAFQALKKALIELPVLALPNSNDPFTLDADASDVAVAAQLLQLKNGEGKSSCFQQLCFNSKAAELLHHKERTSEHRQIY